MNEQNYLVIREDNAGDMEIKMNGAATAGFRLHHFNSFADGDELVLVAVMVYSPSQDLAPKGNW